MTFRSHAILAAMAFALSAGVVQAQYSSGNLAPYVYTESVNVTAMKVAGDGAGVLDLPDADVATTSPSGEGSTATENDLSRVQWAFILGNMILNYWLAKRRGRNAWGWFFGTLLLSVFATIFLLVRKPISGTAAPSSSASAAMVDQSLVQELRAIKGVGTATADKVASKYRTREAVSLASLSDLEEIHGVGKKQGSLVWRHFR